MPVEILTKDDLQPFMDIINYLYKNVEELSSENFKLREGYMTFQQALEYTRYGEKWLNERKSDIGYYQAGKELRFKKAAIDSYMDKHHIQRKQK